MVKLRILQDLRCPKLRKSWAFHVATVDRQWAFARAWLRTQLSSDEQSTLVD